MRAERHSPRRLRRCEGNLLTARNQTVADIDLGDVIFERTNAVVLLIARSNTRSIDLSV